MNKSYRSYLFKGLSSVLLLAIHFFLNSTIGFGQNGTVTGTVTEAETGEPLPGVNVVVDGTTIGTSTNSDGEYRLDVPTASDTLVFSFVGFQTKKVPIMGRSTLDVELQPEAIAGEELVVVGYGRQEKKSVVGAISVTSSEDLERTGAIGDVGQSLTGQLPGVTTLQTTGQPGEESVQFYIRGQSTWNGGEPLVLVDGVQRSLSNLDRSEVESVSVLKDASATAVYGVEGANGVILITTKQGSSRPEGPQITFKANMTGKQISEMPTALSAQSALNIKNDVIEYEVASDESAWAEYTPQEIVNRYGTEEHKNIYPDVDWRDRVFKNVAMSKRFTLNISGGTDFTQYFGMLSYLHEGDMFGYLDDLDNGYDPGFTYDRINYRSNLNFDLSKTTDLKAKVGGYLGFQKVVGNYGSPPNWSRVVKMSDPTTVVPRYEDGIFGYNPNYDKFVVNYEAMLNATGVDRRRRAQVTTDVELTQDLNMLVDGLGITGRVSYDITTSNNGSRIIDGGWQQKYISPDIVLAETAADSAAYITYLHNRTDAGFEYQRPYERYGPERFGIGGLNTQLYYEAALQYNKDIQNHSVTALALFNRRENKNRNNWKSYRENWVGRVTYNYDQRYFLELNGAYSGSEKFGPGYKFDFFPSAAIGYDIASERFFPFEFITQFKVRYSHGVVGSDRGIARWQHIGSFNPGTTFTRFGTSLTSRSPYTQYSYEKIPNPDAHWASALKQNIGLDAELWQGKITLGVDRFWEHRTDIFVRGGSRAIPDLFGAQSNPAANLGETKSKGYEVQLEVNQPLSEKLALWGKFNFAHAKERIIARDDPELLPDHKKQSGYQIGQNRGHYPAGFMSSWDEVYASTPGNLNDNRMPGEKQVVDYNSDGIINRDDSIPWGYPNRPQNTWNSTLGVNVGGWSFSAQFYGVFNIHRLTNLSGFIERRPVVFSYMQKGSKDQWWPTHQNVDGKFASGKLGIFTGSSQVGFHQRDGTYVKLKNANISYSFSGEQLGSWTSDVVSKLRVYASGYNLLFWSRDLPMDAETGGGSTHTLYPIQRRINLGIDISF